MGGEFEKPLNKKKLEIMIDGQNGNKSKNKNSSNTNLKTVNMNSGNKSKFASGTKLVKVTEVKTKRGISHKKNDKKIFISAKDKENLNQEKKVLELIQDKNEKKEDYDMMYEIISKHFFLQTLNDQAKNEIIISMSLYSVKEGKTLFSQGNAGNFWYIVHSGKLNRFVDNKLVGTLKEGDSFGEHALMNNSPRSSTVVSVTECKLWVLKRQIFQKILDFIFTLNYEENMRFLNGINIPLDDAIKAIMANNLIQEIYVKNQYICREGESGTCMYIIKDGEVECIKGKKVIRVLKKGDNFGQKAILEGDKRSLDVKAKTDCKIMSISSEFFKNQFGDNFREYLYLSFISTSFLNSKIFNKISPKMISKTFKNFSFRSLKGDELVYPKGQKITEKLCVVLEGNIVNKKINKIEAK